MAIFLKIYMKDSDTLVFDGAVQEEPNIYYPANTKGRFGTVVIGADYFAISKSAKAAIKRIVAESKKTGDDISCIDIYVARKGEPDEAITFGYMDNSYTEWKVSKILADPDFFIGCGEGLPDVTLLDKIQEIEDVA